MQRFTITDGSVSAVILPGKGATAVSLQKNGVEFLYRDEENLHSPERPRCGIPFLFPTFGRMEKETYCWNGIPYLMPIHGFAHTSSWKTEHCDTDTLELSLTADTATGAMYPFSFRVALTYRIREGALEILQTYENNGAEPMPYAFGFHPYFLVEKLENAIVKANADHYIDFSAGKLLSFEEGALTLTEPENTPEAGAALTGLHSPVVLDIPAEHRRIIMEFSPDYPQLVLWHPKNAPFLCAEPINGTPNGFNTGNHLTLLPGEAKTVTLTIRPDTLSKTD